MSEATSEAHLVGDSTLLDMNVNACVYSYPGITAEQLLADDGLWPEKVPREAIAVSIGTNDIGQDCTLEELLASVSMCAARAKTWVVPSVLPEEWLEPLVNRLPEDLVMEDIWFASRSDMHPTEAQQKKLADALRLSPKIT